MKEDEQLDAISEKPLTFSDHKELTATDCETVAKILNKLASCVREGNFDAFEKFWISNEKEEAKIFNYYELINLRYFYRKENMIDS